MLSSFSRDYTAHVSEAHNGSGTALAEIYDASPAGPRERTVPRRLNLSARALVRPGEPLIAGFVVGGSGAKAVLLRAVGPTLAGFGVSAFLADPRLELFDARSALISGNGDWAGQAEAAAAAAKVGAFALPANSKDAVLTATLGPGACTAQVSGENATSGIALIEVYEVP